MKAMELVNIEMNAHENESELCELELMGPCE